MSLDTKQKRGSAINIGMPFRRWQVEPSGNLNPSKQLSLLRYSSAIDPLFTAVFNKICLYNESVALPTLTLESVSVSSLSSESYSQPSLSSESIVECS